MGLPVRVMAMSERKRLPTTVWTAERAERPAIEGEAILATVIAMIELAHPQCRILIRNPSSED